MSDNLLAHFKKMQAMMVKYLKQDISDKQFISDMIYMLDGPEQREVEAATGWQPIETAPHEGEILLFGEGFYYIGNCAWHENDRPIWWSGDHRVTPTHWMPLPTPPEQDK